MQVCRPSKKATRPARELPESIRKVLENTVLVASGAAVLSLVYILFVILSGKLAASIIGGTDLNQMSRALGIAKSVFLWGIGVIFIAAMIRHYRSESIGFLAMLGGAICWLILPIVVRSRVDVSTSPQLLQLGQSLISSFQSAGGALIILGILRVAIGRIIVLASPAQVAAGLSISAPEAAAIAAERAAERPSLMRRCWELHFCRSSLRSSCPRFLEGVSCWKRRSGCYCDEGLATRLLNGVGANSRAKVAAELDAAHRRSRNRASKQKKRQAPCGECPLYLEHQKHKYRVVSWFAYPAAAATTGITVGYIRNGYRWIEFEVGNFLAQFQLLPKPLTETVFEQASWLSAENGAVLLMGVLLVGVYLQVTELAIFRAKL